MQAKIQRKLQRQQQELSSTLKKLAKFQKLGQQTYGKFLRIDLVTLNEKMLNTRSETPQTWILSTKMFCILKIININDNQSLNTFEITHSDIVHQIQLLELSFL